MKAPVNKEVIVLEGKAFKTVAMPLKGRHLCEGCCFNYVIPYGHLCNPRHCRPWFREDSLCAIFVEETTKPI